MVIHWADLSGVIGTLAYGTSHLWRKTLDGTTAFCKAICVALRRHILVPSAMVLLPKIHSTTSLLSLVIARYGRHSTFNSSISDESGSYTLYGGFAGDDGGEWSGDCSCMERGIFSRNTDVLWLWCRWGPG